MLFEEDFIIYSVLEFILFHLLWNLTTFCFCYYFHSLIFFITGGQDNGISTKKSQGVDESEELYTIFLFFSLAIGY